MVALDYNIVYVALPGIGRGLGFSGASLQWVVSAYAIGFGGFLLLGGRAVDRLGQRRMFIAGFALFGVSCLAGGLAPDPASLVAARVAQGLGAALLSPATLALVSSTYAEGAARNRALALWGAAGSGGLAAGALLGGVLTGAWGWRSALFAMVPLTVVGLGTAPRLLTADGPRRGRVAGFDLPGTLAATSGSALLVFGLVSGPQYGWSSPRSILALAAGVMLLAAFLLIERRSGDPVVPLRMLRRRSLLTAMAVILVFQSTLGGTYYLFTIYLQDGRGPGVPAPHDRLHGRVIEADPGPDRPLGPPPHPDRRHDRQRPRRGRPRRRHVRGRLVLGCAAGTAHLGSGRRRNLPRHVRLRSRRGRARRAGDRFGHGRDRPANRRRARPRRLHRRRRHQQRSNGTH
jgi:MFS family permease